MLGNLCNPNWPGCATNTLLPPQAACIFPIHLAGLLATPFLTLEKLYSFRKPGCVPCLIVGIYFPSVLQDG